MRTSLTITLILAVSLLPCIAMAIPFSSSEREANPGSDVMPPVPQPVRPVDPVSVMPPVISDSEPVPAIAAASSPAVVETAPIRPAPEEIPQISNTAVLQGLNKVTGHTSRLEGPIGVTQRFGNLEIIPRRCWKSAPEDRPEDAILLEIRELRTGEESKRIFLGWMFSSSPGLSGLEHPVYDINVLACEYRPDPEKPAAKAAAEAPKVKKGEDTGKKKGKQKKIVPASPSP